MNLIVKCIIGIAEFFDKIFAHSVYSLVKHISIFTLSVALGIVGLKPEALANGQVEFVQRHIYFFLVAGVIFTALNILEERRLKTKFKRNLRSPENLTLLLKALSAPVDTKASRFSSQIKEFRKKRSYSSAEIFAAITKPQKQFKEITRSLHNFFDSIVLAEGKDISFETSLLILKDDVPVASLGHFPSADPPDRIYCDKTSIVAHALKEKRTIIVDDIAKEKKKKESDRRISKNCTTEKGSAICFPVRCEHTKETPLAIRIVASEKFFSSNNPKIYETIFKHFRLRLLIENALKEFSENVQPT